eukprot:363606-Chlamydomonas_euryale.AAC.2
MPARLPACLLEPVQVGRVDTGINHGARSGIEVSGGVDCLRGGRVMPPWQNPAHAFFLGDGFTAKARA